MISNAVYYINIRSGWNSLIMKEGGGTDVSWTTTYDAFISLINSIVRSEGDIGFKWKRSSFLTIET